MSTLRVDTLQTTDTSVTVDVAGLLDGKTSTAVVNTIADLLALNVQAVTRATTRGRLSIGDGAGATYAYDSTDTTTPDNRGTVLVGAGGERWKLEYAGIADPRLFGAVANGVTDASAAIMATHAAFGEVRLPVGAFAIKTGMTFPAQAMNIMGAGQNQTLLICTVASGDVISHTPTTGNHTFKLRDFTMRAAAAPVSTQWAIHIDGTSQITSTVYNGKFLTGEREKHRGIISGVYMEPVTPASNGFGNGVRITSLPNFTLEHSTFYGQVGYTAGEGYAIDGDGVPVDFRIHDVYAYNIGIGLNFPDYVEAAYVRETELVNVARGVYGRYQAGRSVLAEAVCGSSGLRIGPMHANATLSCVDVKNAPFADISEVLCVLNPAPGTVNAVAMNVETSNLVSMKDNGVQVITPANATNIYGITLHGVTNSTLRDNKAQNANYGIMLVESSVSNQIDGTVCNYASNAFAVGTDSTSTNNVIGRGVADTSTGIVNSVAVGNSQTPAVLVTNATITVTAVATLDVAVAVAAGVFRTTPSVAMAFARDGAKLWGSYKPGSSTATSLVFSFKNSDATVMTAGAYGVEILAAL